MRSLVRINLFSMQPSLRFRQKHAWRIIARANGGAWFGERVARCCTGARVMPQELSVSYQAVKTKVHRLLDAAVEGAKSEREIEECVARWWCMVQPADRVVARKYLLTVLERSNATLRAIATTLPELEGFESRSHAPQSLSRAPEPLSSPAGRA